MGVWTINSTDAAVAMAGPWAVVQVAAVQRILGGEA